MTICEKMIIFSLSVFDLRFESLSRWNGRLTKGRIEEERRFGKNRTEAAVRNI